LRRIRQMNWISVKDKLPRLKSWILIFVPNKGIGIAYYYSIVEKENETTGHLFEPHFHTIYDVCDISGDKRHHEIKDWEVTYWCTIYDIPLP